MVLKLAVSSTQDAYDDQLILKTVTKKTISQIIHYNNNNNNQAFYSQASWGRQSDNSLSSYNNKPHANSNN
jgi:hypothetical protein